MQADTSTSPEKITTPIVLGDDARQKMLADIVAAREDGVPWKTLKTRYGLSIQRLKQLHGDALDKPNCECPRCGHKFRHRGKKMATSHQSA